MTASDPKQAVTIGFHEVKTVLQKSKKKGLEIQAAVTTEVFAILAKGEGSKLNWPHTFHYNNPLIRWSSTVERAYDRPVLSEIIDHVWNELEKEGCSGDNLPNPYTIFHKAHGQIFKQLPIKPSERKDIIRLNTKEKPVLDIKARKPDKTSIHHHLKHNKHYYDEYLKMVKNHHLRPGEMFQASASFRRFHTKFCSGLPVSFQYPTISIMNNLLPRPNNLCGEPKDSTETQSDRSRCISVTSTLMPSPTAEAQSTALCHINPSSKPTTPKSASQITAATTYSILDNLNRVPELANSFDNHAHIQFCDENYTPRIPSEE